MKINVPEEYESLGDVFFSALRQAAEGKGRERHAEDGEPYERQIICEVARRVGLGYPLGQAVKKIYESQRLIPQLGVQELLGAMNYIAAAYIVMQERMDEEGRRFREGAASSRAEGCEELVQPRSLFPGDAVEVLVGGEWEKGVYCRALGRGKHEVILDAGGAISVSDELLAKKGAEQ